ncbi:MAG: pantetheine-phosphate adenylyltransferase [Christensenellales bacterium]|jgi:pantetheine-phosphate adenylyltransferase
MRTGVYAGSFDPVTMGHMDIISRAAKQFDHVVVAVTINSEKKHTFAIQERVEMLRDAIAAAQIPNATVESFTGLTVDFATQVGACVMIRGLRAVSDFEYEFQIAAINSKLKPELETILMMTSSQYSFLSSSIVREAGKYGGSIEHLVPDVVLERVRERLLRLQ